MKSLKRISGFLASLALFSTAAQALPLVREEVAADAKWLIHLDVDAFRKSQLGTWLVKEGLADQLQLPIPPVEGMTNALQGLKIEHFHSLTAYGSNYDLEKLTGVIIARLDPKLAEQLEQMAQALAVMDTNALKVVQTEPHPVFFVGDQVYVSSDRKGTLLIGKSRDHLDKARAVSSRKAPNLTSNKSFNDYPAGENGFFFLGVADAINEKTQIPPQAQVLKMTEGAQIQLGERAEELFLNLTLKAKTPEVTAQIQQVTQGMVALLALAQLDPEAVKVPLPAFNVQSKDRFVTVAARYSVTNALKQINALMEEEMDKPKPAKKPKKAKAKPIESIEEVPAEKLESEKKAGE